MKEIAALGQAARELFPAAFVEDAPTLPDAPAFVHGFAGLVSLADWIASNCNEGFFPYFVDGVGDGRDGEGGGPRYALASARARDVLSALLHKARFERVSPYPRRSYATGRVIGVPRAVKRFMAAMRMCISAT